MTITCPYCGFTFKSAFNFVNSMETTIVGNTETCPRCHKTVHGPSGTFNFDARGEIEQILSGPEFTVEVLEKLKNVSKKAANAKYTPQQFTELLEKEVPEAKAITRLLTRENFRDLMSLLAVLIAAIGAIIAFKGLAQQKDQPPVVNNIKIDLPVMTDGEQLHSEAKRETKMFSPKPVKPSNKRSRITK